jgi:hypothetical protein
MTDDDNPKLMDDALTLIGMLRAHISELEKQNRMLLDALHDSQQSMLSVQNTVRSAYSALKDCNAEA